MAPVLFLALSIGAFLIMGASANNLQFPQQGQEAMTDAFIDSMDSSNVVRAMQKRPFCNIYAGCGKKRSSGPSVAGVQPVAGPTSSGLLGGSPTAGTGAAGATGPGLSSRPTNNNGREFVSVVDLVGMQKQLIEQLTTLTDTIMERHVQSQFRLPMPSSLQAEYRQQSRQKRSVNQYSIHSSSRK